MALLRVCCSFVLLFAFGAVSSFSQLYTGSIAGTVKDPSGSVIPNAQVTITDAQKGFKYSAASDAGGQFTVKNLPPATYNETVNAPGFSSFERNHIVLEVNGNVNADASLQLSSAGQTVT
ncbi:MAG: carboxypeptidase regulatory-like domain-containing protein, partial [Mucilaginibacter polytrichastri]|nr:carboxypeptidase regulatory-like domain-containing protein [Mucilaginibacter polytrichastri]